MMYSSRIYLNSFISLVVTAVLGAPIDTISYIGNIKMSFKNDLWICGDIECPTYTFGCRIQRHAATDNNMLLQSTYNCFDENKISTKSSVATNEMVKSRKIEIDIESYKGAESIYSTGYGLGGHERAEGTISPDDWNDFKDSAKRNMKVVEESNA
ncbi:uncharacterized protein [Musca autumnalis]|uniref:uncharacterized protein n=1 Tax=Musca autumnalis TaxID=221902 RepID=UPI003CF282DA